MGNKHALNMKNITLLLAAIFIVSACGPSRYVPKNNNETVNLGYVQENKDNSTSGVSSLKVKQASGYTNIYEYLKGRVPGVDVQGTSIIIRGIRSINASNEPLILVDGQQVEDISWLSPEDVQSIDVLKDASSTAMYGSRGANGVILVTTRRANDK